MQTQKILKTMFVLLAAAISAGALASARAAIVTQPAGLTNGQPYRLVFVTSGTRDATSATIGDYNAFVTTAATNVAALNALGTTWAAIAATATIDVRTNTLTGALDPSAPLYRLDGVQVATGNTDLWDSAIAAGISITEAGNSLNTKVWTGVGETFNNEYRLGTGGWNYYGVSTGTVRTVYADRVGATGWTADLDETGTASLSFYAMSGVLTAVNELVSLTLAEHATWDCLVGETTNNIVNITGALTLPTNLTVAVTIVNGPAPTRTLVLFDYSAGTRQGATDLSGWTVTGLEGYTCRLDTTGKRVLLVPPDRGGPVFFVK